MAQWPTNRLAYLLATAGVDLTGATLKALLVKSSYAPTAATIRALNVVNDLTPGTNELSVSGYARVTLSSKTVTEDDANDRAAFDCDDIAFGALAAGQTIGAVVIYKFVTNDTDSPVLGWFDLTATATNGSTVTVTIDSTGAIHLKTT